jgi:hypothetical protein
MNKRLINAGRAAMPFLLVLAFTTALNAQSGNQGLDKALSFGQVLLTWLRNAALIVFVGALVWGCIEAAVESWREGRGKIFTSVGCAIVAGIAQALISGIYSTTG